MGRKTHESIGRALPGRINIVISRDKNYKAKGCQLTSSLDEALRLVRAADEVFIIGGSSIYEQTMPKVDKLYLTKVKANIAGDKYFDFNRSEWRQASTELHPADEKNNLAFELQQWLRK